MKIKFTNDWNEFSITEIFNFNCIINFFQFIFYVHIFGIPMFFCVVIKNSFAIILFGFGIEVINNE